MESHDYDMELEELEQDPILNCLCDYLRKHQPRVQMLNVIRYSELLFAKAALDDVIQKSMEPVQSEITYFPEFSSVSLSVEFESLEVYDLTTFSLATRYADNFEIVPLADGRIRLAFMFRRMMITLSKEAG